jgi:plastocyanin
VTATLVLASTNGTPFYVLGICLATLALVVTAIGLRNPDAFSSRVATRAGIALFAVLVLGTVTFAVRYSKDEQADRRAELAKEEAKVGGTELPSAGGEVPTPDAAELGGGTEVSPPSEGKKQAAPKGQATSKGPGGTLKLAADPTQIAYDKTALSSKPGKVTIDFDNPSQVSHDVAIAKGSTEIAKSDLIASSSTSVSADLAPGKYVFFCTVPGHREAGMQGTLTVK